jgi:hypothetical protein
MKKAHLLNEDALLQGLNCTMRQLDPAGPSVTTASF